MQILTVDIGTGTQDVLLFDSDRELENCFKLVLPSPTVVIADRVRAATAMRRRLVLEGVTMGGGPSHWATMDHVRAGLEAFATPEAARPAWIAWIMGGNTLARVGVLLLFIGVGFLVKYATEHVHVPIEVRLAGAFPTPYLFLSGNHSV